MQRLTNMLKKLRHTSRVRQVRDNTNHLTFEWLEQRALLAGLVSHWTADNTANDAVGGNHGSLVSGATYAAGQIGQAFSFDGINDRVQVQDSESLRLTGSLTIEAWIKATSLPTEHGFVLFRGDDRGGLDPYELGTTPGGGMKFGVSSLTAGSYLTAPMPLGEFVHVVGTLDDATGAMRLYMNSVLMAETVTTVRPFGDLDPASNPSIGIGNHGGYPTTPHNFPFHGLIDELSVYDTALSQQEVLDHFNAGKGDLQPLISIGDATVTEGDQSMRYQGNLVSALEGGLSNPYSMVIGPDGNLYVSTKVNTILRYDLVTGASLPAAGKSGAEFVSQGAGGLDSPRQVVFGPDGDLYVASEFTDSILRFDGVTGEPLGELVTSGSGGLSRPRGLFFGPDGYLYVTSVGIAQQSGPGTDSVLRYDAQMGTPAGLSGQVDDAVFISSGSGGLDNPSELVLHNGSFYVSSTSPGTSNSVLRYGINGEFLDAFVPTGSGGLSGPVDLEFRDGYLYVTSWANNKVLRYSESTGAFVDEIVPSTGGLGRPINLAFDPAGNMLVSSGDTNEIRRYGNGSAAVVTISLNGPFPTPLAVDLATNNGTAVVGSDYESTIGVAQFSPGQISKTIVIRTLDDSVFEGTETFTVNLSNAIGATISRAQGTVTILDDELPPTKFYVVNDGSQDRTYEYATTGTSVENYSTTSGNSAPRGAASTAAGDKVWVVNANRKVYVYNTSGGLLGSWTAGSLSSNATVEGIATNGTDIWIVDEKSDKVFKYTGAATRLSGTQNAASSFSLNGSNTAAKDIVTDGTSLWVVNNATIDKVFKYSIAGALLGSWTISTSGASSPTGITLDPANPSHIWIVDNGTDRVYQYDAATSRVSGSQAASTSFPLAAGNTNPQGIADPPPAPDTPVEVVLASYALDSNSMSMLLVDVGNFTDSFANRPREVPIPNRIRAAQPLAVGGHPQNIRALALTAKSFSRECVEADLKGPFSKECAKPNDDRSASELDIDALMSEPDLVDEILERASL